MSELPKEQKCTCSMCLKENFNGDPSFYRVVRYNACEADTLCKWCLDEVKRFIREERKKAARARRRNE
jgi:hypothetical protein